MLLLDSAADLVDDLSAELDDMERVQDRDRMALAYRDQNWNGSSAA
jgi:hypothetical protein